MTYNSATLFVRCEATCARAMLRFPKGTKVKHTPTWDRYPSLERVLKCWALADIAIVILPAKAAQ
jgi:hypothetical protein